MRIEDLPTRMLRRMLRATLKAMGPHSAGVRLFRAELARRARTTRTPDPEPQQAALLDRARQDLADGQEADQ